MIGSYPIKSIKKSLATFAEKSRGLVECGETPSEKPIYKGPHMVSVKIRFVGHENFTKWIFRFIFLTRKKIKSLGRCILLRKKVMRLTMDKPFSLSQQQTRTILSIFLDGGSIAV